MMFASEQVPSPIEPGESDVEAPNLYEKADDRTRLAALVAFQQQVTEGLPDSVLARSVGEMLEGIRSKDRELIAEQAERTYGKETERRHMEQLRLAVDIAIQRLVDPDREIETEERLVERFRRGGTTPAAREFAEERLRAHQALLEDARRLKKDLEEIGGAEALRQFLPTEERRLR